MCRKVDELARALTPDERGAIEELGRAKGTAGAGAAIPFALAERLMDLGLVELSFGGLDLTVAGRLALAALRGQDSELAAGGVA